MLNRIHHSLQLFPLKINTDICMKFNYFATWLLIFSYIFTEVKISIKMKIQVKVKASYSQSQVGISVLLSLLVNRTLIDEYNSQLFYKIIKSKRLIF